MDSFTKKYILNAPVSKVWTALVQPKLIQQWGGGQNPEMSDKVGGAFKLWDGDIWGKNIDVIPEKLLKQEWFGGKWDKPSIVTFELHEKDGKTEVTLTHEDIPENSDSFKSGWDDYYMGPLKELVEKKE